MSRILAVYGGTFDPVTNGHLDMIRRGASLFGGLLVCVSQTGRKTLFDAEERITLMRQVTANLEGVEVEGFEGLLVVHALARGARALLRGVRSAADLEVEAQMAFANRGLAPALDTVFLLPTPRTRPISSTLVREVSALGGDVSAWVPAAVVEALARKHASGHR